MTENKRYYVNCAGYLCDKELSNTLSIFECADLLNHQEKMIKQLNLTIKGLRYVLQHIKQIDVEIDLNELPDCDV